ncbi:MAG: ATP-grasp domain-containing protein [Frankiaceae bacterium]
MVHGSHEEVSSPFLQACDVAFPEPAKSGGAFAAFALEYCRSQAIDVFIPGREMEAVARRRADFEAAGTRVMVSPLAAVRELADKDETYRRARKLGVAVPEYRVVDTAQGFAAAVRELSAAGHTLCFKPVHDHGGQGFRILDEDADSYAALTLSAAPRISSRHATQLLSTVGSFPPLMVSEFLAGPEFSVDCLSIDGRMLVAVPRGKGGAKWTRELQADAGALGVAETMVTAYGLSYLSNVQVRYQRGVPVLLEVNTRPAAGLWQSEAARVNLPFLAVQLLVEGTLDVPQPRFGAVLVELPDTIPYRPPW